MLANKLINAGKLEQARNVVDSLPEYSPLDKRSLQAELSAKNGDTAQAAAILERKLRLSVTDNITTLIKLIRYAAAENNTALAYDLAECARMECAAYRLGAYWENIAPMEAAIALKDKQGAITCLGVIFAELDKSLNVGFSSLFTHSADKIPKDTKVDTSSIRAPLIAHLKNDEEYEFLHNDPEFEKLLSSLDEK